MFFNEKHIRVLKPKTSNGLNPILDDRGQIVHKVIHLPFTAKKDIEAQNSRLPNHLKMKIEVIDFNAPIEPEVRRGRSKQISNEEN